MKILLTGGAGFIGSHVAEAYLAAGHEVHIADNLVTGRREHCPPGAVLHEVDIRAEAFAALVERLRPEVVNHHAAQASVKVSTGDIQFDLAVNGAGTARVAELCVRHRVPRLIYASSGGTVYGNPETLPVAETHALRPVSPYGLSKLVGEQYIELMARMHGLTFAILRYANAFGPRQDPNGEAGVVAIFTGRMLAAEQCTIDGDGEQRKDYIYVGDIARANVLALATPGSVTANIGTGVGASVNTIFRALQAETGDATAPRFGPPRPGDVRDFWLDVTHARETLGWAPGVSFAEGIRRTVASYRRAVPATG